MGPVWEMGPMCVGERQGNIKNIRNYKGYKEMVYDGKYSGSIMY
jgi:hypothetical protein